MYGNELGLNLTGYLAVPLTAVDGAVIDGSVDCGGLCGGGGSASGELNGPITIDGTGFTQEHSDATMYECGAGVGGFSTLGGASAGYGVAVGPMLLMAKVLWQWVFPIWGWNSCAEMLLRLQVRNCCHWK